MSRYLPNYAGDTATARRAFAVARAVLRAEQALGREVVNEASPALRWLEEGGDPPTDRALDAGDIVARAVSKMAPVASGTGRPDLARADAEIPDLGRVWMEAIRAVG